ncbi:ABC transporter permease [Alicyclobacillus cellulosilyticus]|uniref:ABC transporter permease n=1 Tax=Alicyclobacillus cellulosilyticus TaxID=1003997 RepID=A0A917KIN4_9BACL|nr:sugar ABC transporter permease [Alicyclobacillus cellulosilyticus]GGJ12874.1 ABC transporter permease [Alicyclobacillus cellulosilyticus]
MSTTATTLTAAAAPLRARRSLLAWCLRYALVLPPAAVVVIFVAWPLWVTLYHSFFQLDARGHAVAFAGSKNYQALFASPLFHQVLWNTAVYSVLAVVLCVSIAFGLSLLLYGRVAASSRALLVALFSPTVMPMIAAANIWLYFLIPQFGMVDQLLRWAGLGHENWLGHPGTALLVMVMLFVWKYAPYFALFLLAGLQAIPPDVWEALRTEDPYGWASFRRVILPILRPMLAFVTTMAVLYAVETVDPVFAMTQGGPNNGTNLVMFYLYNLGFNYYSWGPAAALSVLLMIGLSTLSGLSLIVLERRAFHWQ